MKLNKHLYSFDKLAYNNPTHTITFDSGREYDYNPFRSLAAAEERAYIKSLKPHKMLEYLEQRNHEEFLNII